MTKGRTIAEAAADVLAASIKASPQDKFGAGTKLFRSSGTDASPTIIDLGGAHTKAEQGFPDFTRGVPTATPPGATPPVGKEEMHTVENQRGYAGKQPQKTEGRGINSGIEGVEPMTAQARSNRTENNPFRKVTPGAGMVRVEEFSDEEVDTIIAEMKKHFEKKDGEEDKDEDKKNVKFKFGKKFKKESKEKMCEELELTDEELEQMLITESEDEELPSISDSIAMISQEILEASKEQIAEDVDAIFSGETLSEDFRNKVSTIFNAAVATRFNEVVSKLETVIVEQVDAQVEAIKEELTESVDDYLNYMVEEWIKENEVAIQKGLKAEIVEDFIIGLRNLFVEHYIDIPEEKMDLVGELQEKVEELETSLNEEIRRGIELKKSLSESKKEEVLHAVCEGLTKTQSEKIRTLAENVDFSSAEDFTGKVKTLKENYFPTSVTRQATDALDRDPEVLSEENDKVITDSRIAAYSKIISNTKLS